MLKKSVVAKLKVLNQHLPVVTEENHKTLSQDSLSVGQDLNMRPPKYKAGVLTTPPQSSVRPEAINFDG
jgi:hypothetical protein